MTNAWIAIDHGLAADLTLSPYTLRLEGEHLHYAVNTIRNCLLIQSIANNFITESKSGLVKTGKLFLVATATFTIMKVW